MLRPAIAILGLLAKYFWLFMPYVAKHCGNKRASVCYAQIVDEGDAWLTVGILYTICALLIDCAEGYHGTVPAAKYILLLTALYTRPKTNAWVALEFVQVGMWLISGLCEDFARNLGEVLRNTNNGSTNRVQELSNRAPCTCQRPEVADSFAMSKQEAGVVHRVLGMLDHTIREGSILHTQKNS